MKDQCFFLNFDFLDFLDWFLKLTFEMEFSGFDFKSRSGLVFRFCRFLLQNRINLRHDQYTGGAGSGGCLSRPSHFYFQIARTLCSDYWLWYCLNKPRGNISHDQKLRITMLLYPPTSSTRSIILILYQRHLNYSCSCAQAFLPMCTLATAWVVIVLLLSKTDVAPVCFWHPLFLAPFV